MNRLKERNRRMMEQGLHIIREATRPETRRNWLSSCWFCGAEIAVDDDGYAECGCGMSQLVPREKMRPLD